MMTRRSHALGVFISVLTGAFLAVMSAAPAFGHGFARSPGPPHCPTGGSGGAKRGGGCPGGKGSPATTINTFTGNLTISDTPVFYQAVGDAIPFTISYNSQWDRPSALGPRWTHTYQIYVIDDDYGATVIEGNGWEHYFDWDPIAQSYLSPDGVFDKLEKTTNPSGWTLTRPSREVLTFDGSGNLVGRADADGLLWELEYTGGLLTRIGDPLGRDTTLQYDGNSRIEWVTVPGGRRAHFRYDANGRLWEVTDAGGYASQLYYDANGRVSNIVYPSGSQVWFTYAYNAYLQLTVVSATGIANVAGATVIYDYTPSNGHLITTITETKDGAERDTCHIHEFTDDPGTGRYPGTLLEVAVDPGDPPHANALQNWAYDSEYRMIRHRDSWQPETGGKAHRHFYEYTDTESNPDKVTKYIDPQNSDANPNETGNPSENCPGYVYEYDDLGNKISETSPEGRVTEYTYYAGTNRLHEIIIHDEDVNGNPVNRTTTYTYWGADYGYQVRTMTDGRGNVTNYAYEADTGYLASVTPAAGGATTYQYDEDQYLKAVTVTDGNGNSTVHLYDALDREVSVTYPDIGAGQKSHDTGWTCCGIEYITDENGRITLYEYEDYTDRLKKVREDLGGLEYVTEYTYDEVGNLKTEKNARNKTTTYFYDAADRKIHADYPDGTHESWSYRDDGRVLQHADARGRTTTYRYDADDRLWGPYGSGYVAINYPNDTDVNITRDMDGLITHVTDGGASTTNTYYPSTWLKSVQRPMAGGPVTLTYQYNGVGLVSALNPFTYTYNARNQLESVVKSGGPTVSFTYDDGGRRTRVTRPGSYIQYEYNARDWITAVQNRTTGGLTRYDASYYYNDGVLWDHTGNPLKRVENFGGSDFTTTLRYDSVYRQTEETKRNSGGAVQYTLLYGYDAVGNRTTRRLGGLTTTYTYDDNNKLTYASRGVQFANFYYDENGNMLRHTGSLYGTKVMVYNDENRMTSVTYGGVTDTYNYNWQGLRTSATLGGSSKLYLYNGDRVYQERFGPNVTATYMTENDSYYGTLLHIQRATGESRFPLYDEIGSARGLVDAAGAVTDTYEMDTFGKPVSTTGSTPNPYKFGAAWGYITDPSGFLQLGARFYWPEVGRFVSQDPIGEGTNWYAYAEDNPAVSVDAEGTKCSRQAAAEITEDLNIAERRCDRNRRQQAPYAIIPIVVGAALGARGGPGAALGGAAVGMECAQDSLNNQHHNCLADAWDDYRRKMNRAGCRQFKMRTPPWRQRQAAAERAARARSKGIQACHSVGRP